MILFEKIRWRNFLSTGNDFTEIRLNKSPTTLIVGNNGSGKSTLLDALTFALFGKPFRGVNKPGLLNSVNEKDCVVEIEFVIGKKSYKIVRGIKPGKFEIYCDNELVNQDASSRDYQEYLEKFILKMNYKSFTQIVVLGSSTFVPFMQLSSSDRRTIIEDLLDIQIFSFMNVVLKQKLQSIKESIGDVMSRRELTKVRIESTKKLIAEIANTKTLHVEKMHRDIANSKSQIVSLEKEKDTLDKEIEKLQEQISGEKKLVNKSNKLNALIDKITENSEKAQEEIDFYQTKDDCPTCRQSISKDFKLKQIKLFEKKIAEYDTGLKDIDNELEKINSKISEIQKTIKTIKTKTIKSQEKNATIVAITNYIEKLEKETEVIEINKTSDTKHTDDLKSFEDELVELIEQEKELINQKHHHDQVSVLLKDTGIKTKIIKQYLPVMNKLINKYLNSMEFYVNFNINESFEEVIKSRHRDEFAYENFSEGEKQKIDLALLFTWRAIAKMKNSVNTNLLILDEIFDSSLDSNGTEELLKILNSISSDTNVFVISHKGDILFDKFRSIIKFEKINNFSRIVK
jgi:DNA repair exonuclease SbcCD ATPase subunit